MKGMKIGNQGGGGQKDGINKGRHDNVILPSIVSS